MLAAVSLPLWWEVSGGACLLVVKELQVWCGSRGLAHV